MIVNIVMISHNRHMLMHQTLRSLYRNTPKELFNLTIIDDESAIPPEPHQRSNYTMLRIWKSKHILGQAKNLGVYWAEHYWGRGDYLYISDNDVYFTPQWLETLIEALASHPEVRLLGGWNHPHHHTIEVQDEVHIQNTLAGPSWLMDWHTWDGYGPLISETPGVCKGEDGAFTDKIVASGFKVGAIIPHVVISTGVTNSYGELAPGADQMVDELRQVQQTYRDMFWQ